MTAGSKIVVNSVEVIGSFPTVLRIVGTGRRGGDIRVTVHFNYRGLIDHAFQHDGTPLVAGGGFMSPETIPLEIKTAAWDQRDKVV